MICMYNTHDDISIQSPITTSPSQFTSSRIMTLAKETEKEKDTPKAREAIYLLLDLVSEGGEEGRR